MVCLSSSRRHVVTHKIFVCTRTVHGVGHFLSLSRRFSQVLRRCFGLFSSPLFRFIVRIPVQPFSPSSYRVISSATIVSSVRHRGVFGYPNSAPSSFPRSAVVVVVVLVYFHACAPY